MNVLTTLFISLISAVVITLCIDMVEKLSNDPKNNKKILPEVRQDFSYITQMITQ